MAGFWPPASAFSLQPPASTPLLTGEVGVEAGEEEGEEGDEEQEKDLGEEEGDEEEEEEESLRAGPCASVLLI